MRGNHVASRLSVSWVWVRSYSISTASLPTTSGSTWRVSATPWHICAVRQRPLDADGGAVVALMREKERVFRDLVRERVRIFPGVRELLASLREGDDPLPTAIGSGALGSEIRLILGIAGLESFFDGIVAADDVSVGKPDPETFLRACELLAVRSPGLGPEQCLVIEDSAGGLAAGRAAGMTTVGVANSYPAADLVADLVVDSLEEIDRARCEALFES